MEVKGVSLWLARGPAPWPLDAPVDVPSERLIERGFSCIAQEGCLSLAIRPPDGRTGERAKHKSVCVGHWQREDLEAYGL